jgi:hypothetical protein
VNTTFNDVLHRAVMDDSRALISKRCTPRNSTGLPETVDLTKTFASHRPALVSVGRNGKRHRNGGDVAACLKVLPVVISTVPALSGLTTGDDTNGD